MSSGGSSEPWHSRSAPLVLYWRVPLLTGPFQTLHVSRHVFLDFFKPLDGLSDRELQLYDSLCFTSGWLTIGDRRTRGSWGSLQQEQGAVLALPRAVCAGWYSGSFYCGWLTVPSHYMGFYNQQSLLWCYQLHFELLLVAIPFTSLLKTSVSGSFWERQDGLANRHSSTETGAPVVPDSSVSVCVSTGLWPSLRIRYWGFLPGQVQTGHARAGSETLV